jgi:hypothetical protein
MPPASQPFSLLTGNGNGHLQPGIQPSVQRQPPAAAARYSFPQAQHGAPAGGMQAQQQYLPPAPPLIPADLWNGLGGPGPGLPGFLPASHMLVPMNGGGASWLAAPGTHPPEQQQQLGDALDMGYRADWETDNDLQALFEDD